MYDERLFLNSQLVILIWHGPVSQLSILSHCIDTAAPADSAKLFVNLESSKIKFASVIRIAPP